MTMPTTVRTLMVATDFSAPAAAALSWGGDLAKEHGARLIVVHALEVGLPDVEFLPIEADAGGELQAAIGAKLAELVAPIVDSGVEVKLVVEIGLASEAITRAVNDHAPELLVVGNRGGGGFLRLLVGSTTQRLARRVACPVLTVHEDDKHRAVRSILVPTDFSRDAEAAAATASRLLHPAEAGRLVLVHAFHMPVEYTAYGAIPTTFHFREDVLGPAQERLEALAAKLARPGLDVVCEVREGAPAEVVADVARERDVDLVAMGTHGRSGLAHVLLGSTAERVLAIAPCPVLTVRHPEA